jgi:hypothetical protein
MKDLSKIGFIHSEFSNTKKQIILSQILIISYNLSTREWFNAIDFFFMMININVFIV